MHPCVAVHMLLNTLHVIYVLRGEHVAHELGVEVQGMVRGTNVVGVEVVHSEDVFQALGVKEVAHPTGLSGRVELVRQPVGGRVELMVVA